MSDDDQWRFGVDDLGEAGEGDGTDDGETGEGVLGSTDSRLPDPEPGSPSLENTAFVLLGSLTVVAIIALLLF
ncbi:DUF7312 domain-containing protein [Halomarina litorea]|uniref:DUF7312 domain-containing protein n=1 Tax=Halomarina litorea TaxID=2961595 RepID=UPI0020C4CAD7|nr:hypothetical protein [Halomarina sp. BCD28]